jgi:hypothetical protein
MTGNGTFTDFKHEEVRHYTTPEDGYLHLFRVPEETSPVITYQRNTWLKVEHGDQASS